MDDKPIYEKLTEIFRDILDDEHIVLTPKTTAQDILEWDSVNHINIVVAVETKFGIKFKSAEIEKLKNVGEFATLIKQRLAAK
jgi:acyl carrier protein